MKYILALFLSAPFLSLQAQIDAFSDFGLPSPAETSLKQCDYDPGAGAVYLHKDAITFSDNQRMVVAFRNRIKILKTPAAGMADIRIKVYAKNEWETIEDLRAVTINCDGNGLKKMATVDARNFYRTKEDDTYDVISFSMPEVREGSIIEYSYTSIRKSYKIVDYWYFQDEIPVLNSLYDYTILPGAQFSYRVLKPAGQQVNVKEYKTQGRIAFDMHNLPGVTDEPFMDSKRDYLSRLELQMNYSGTGVDRDRFVGTWPELTEQLEKDEYFGLAMRKSIAGTDMLISEAALVSSGKKKMDFIFNQVQRQMEWNRYIGIYASDRLKLAWEKHRGSAAEINLILINLLLSAGLKAEPMLVSDRFHGKVDMSQPFINQFSKVIAYLELDGRSYFLDASMPGNMTSLIPESLLNTKGYVVNRKNSRFVDISDPGHYDKRNINIMGTITNEGIINGQAFIIDRDYSRAQRESRLRADSIGYVHETFVKPYSLMRIDSIRVENLDNDTLALNQLVGFSHQMEKADDYFLLRYNLFSGMENNPFLSDHRYTEINFGCNRSLYFNESYTVSESLTLEGLPKNVRMITPDTSITISRIMQFTPESRKLSIVLRLDLNRSRFDAEDYPFIREFFKKLYSILEEPVVIRTKP